MVRRLFETPVFSLFYLLRSATFAAIRPFNGTSAFCSRFFSSSSDIVLALQETLQRCGGCGFGHQKAENIRLEVGTYSNVRRCIHVTCIYIYMLWFMIYVCYMCSVICIYIGVGMTDHDGMTCTVERKTHLQASDVFFERHQTRDIHRKILKYVLSFKYVYIYFTTLVKHMLLKLGIISSRFGANFFQNLRNSSRTFLQWWCFHSGKYPTTSYPSRTGKMCNLHRTHGGT